MTSGVQGDVQSGLRAHREGRLAEAVAAYDRVLLRSPDHATARHLRGFAYLQLNRPDVAVDDLRIATRLLSGNETVLLHFLTCLERLRRFSEAKAIARRLLILQPDARAALDILTQHGSDREAAGARALAVSPTDPVTWAHAAIAIAAADAETAAGLMDRAVLLSPADAIALLDLAHLKRAVRRPDIAEKLCTRALVVRPAHPRALAERAAAWIDLVDNGAALADTRQALIQEPSLALGWINRGEARYQVRFYDQALSDAERARVCAPSDVRILGNLGAYHLALGHLAQGWRLFRNRPAAQIRRSVELPEWTGEPGARLLVLAEQGLGDELLFSTLWADLKALVRDKHLDAVTIEIDPRLIPLARRALPGLLWRDRNRPAGGADDAMPTGEWTHRCLAGDLPALLRPTVDRFAQASPGLRVDPDSVEHWRRWLRSVNQGRPTIGLCWRSGNLRGHRKKHYPSLSDCAALLALPKRLFVVLQYDDCSEEVGAAHLGAGTEMVLPPELDRREDQAGVAALMTALDGVISGDTAVLALAGALGNIPTIGFGLHAGWLGLGQPKSPWFANVSSVYHKPGQHWSQTMAAVADRAVALGL